MIQIHPSLHPLSVIRHLILIRVGGVAVMVMVTI